MTAAESAPRYGDVDEAIVLVRLREGDEAMFRDVVARLTPVLTRLARTYTPTTAAAQDVVQDSWLTVLDKLDSFEGRSSLKTWICGIVVNNARRSGRRENRTLPFSSAWRDDRGPAVEPGRFHGSGSGGQTGTWVSPPVRWDHLPEDRMAATELRQVIDSAIAALPTRQREVITARDVLGLDADETAAILAVSAGNQRVLLHRARGKVRAALEQYGADIVDNPPSGIAAVTALDGMRAAPAQRDTHPLSDSRARAPGPSETSPAATVDLAPSHDRPRP